MPDRNGYKARSNAIGPLTEMPSQTLLAVVFSTFLVTPSLGATITQASQLTRLTYDYIIIGGVSPRILGVYRLYLNYQLGPLDLLSRID